MPKKRSEEDQPLKGDILVKNTSVSESTMAAMPGAPSEREKFEHPEVWLNGKHYMWQPGQTDGIPEEALAIWARALEANS